MANSITSKDILNLMKENRQCRAEDVDMDLANEEVAKALIFDASGTMKNAFPPKISEEDLEKFIKIQ